MRRQRRDRSARVGSRLRCGARVRSRSKNLYGWRLQAYVSRTLGARARCIIYACNNNILYPHVVRVGFVRPAHDLRCTICDSIIR